ncbi:hypothetical protein PR048_014530 [Dryococelus australis]|uniref:Uncharacterized protein n=1 Tax=Dryococelus australis TaxID=614101 RepID=A0ABQ9HEH2_9NEOP|nr:hypothetical protein PR048_014530 [Dryococelus australis]
MTETLHALRLALVLGRGGPTEVHPILNMASELVNTVPRLMVTMIPDTRSQALYSILEEEGIDGMQRCGKWAIPEKTHRPAASSCTIPTCKHLGATPPGIKPGSQWWEAILCGIVLCGVVLCGVVLCGIVLCWIVLCRIVLCGIVLCGIVLWGIVLCGVVLCGIVLCGVVLCGIVLCWIVLCRIVLWGIVLCGIVLCGIVLCGIVLCGIVLCGIVLCGHVEHKCAVCRVFASPGNEFESRVP